MIASCASEPVTLPGKTFYVFTPDSFLVPCAIPEWKGGAWVDSSKLAVQRKAAIIDCNERLKKARDWNAEERAKIRE